MPVSAIATRGTKARPRPGSSDQSDLHLAAQFDHAVDGEQLEARQVAELDRLVRRGDSELHLAPKEYAVLAELAKHQGRVLSHSHLLRAVWGPAHAEQVNYLRVAVRSLRQKIEPDPGHPALLLNEPGVGYRLRA